MNVPIERVLAAPLSNHSHNLPEDDTLGEQDDDLPPRAETATESSASRAVRKVQHLGASVETYAQSGDTSCVADTQVSAPPDVSCNTPVSQTGNTTMGPKPNGEALGCGPSTTRFDSARSLQIPLAEQLAIFDRFASEGFDLFMRRLRDMRSAIIARERQRMATLGTEAYGDRTFHRTLADLYDEMDAEGCDGVFYGAVIAWHEDRLRRGLL
jgi:hypothetical protein